MDSSSSVTSSIVQAMPRSHPWDPNVLLRGSENVKQPNEGNLKCC